MSKEKILYIAKNIPIPSLRANNVILRIAQKLDQYIDTHILYPKEFVPWGFHFLKKYKPFYKLKTWKAANGKTIEVLPYYRLPIESIAFLFSTFNIGNKVINRGYSLIHAHYLFADGILAMHLADRWDIPFVVSIRKSDVNLLKRNSNNSTIQNAKKVLAKASAVHVLNGITKQFIEEKYGCACTVIPHGIESAIVAEENGHQKGGDEIKISTVGDAIPLKQIDWVIRSVMAYQGNKKVSLCIVGDGPELDKLKSLANGRENITFLGRVKHEKVIEVMSQSHIFALPSNNETFGLVYIEASARHNAILSYKGTGIDGVLIDGKECLLIDSYDAFNAQLTRLIEEADLRKTLSENAFAKAKAMTWENIIQQYMEMYHSYPLKTIW